MMRGWTGEFALCLAVLEDALARLGGSDPERLGTRPNGAARVAQDIAETRAWFERVGDREEAFSFEWVCDAVGLAADPLRRAALGGRLTHVPLRRFLRRGHNARPPAAREVA
jgi:hypothetical protein